MRNSQHIFILECSASSRTDYLYIRKLLNSVYFAPNDGSLLISPVYLDGKTNYNNPSREKDVLNHISSYPGKSYVHYVFDIDRGLRKDKSLNAEIERYVNAKRYCDTIVPDIIWFNKNIEQVILGHSVSDNKKVIAAIEFNAKGKVNLDKRSMNLLSNLDLNTEGSSNFLSVLYPLIPPGKKASEIWKK